MANRLRVVRSEPDTEPARDRIFIAGVACDVTLWSRAAWSTLPVDQQPEHARPIGDCYLEIVPVTPTSP